MDFSVPSTQRAVVATKTGSDFAIEINDKYPVPILKEGQVLVRLTYSGVCHSDLSALSGIWDHASSCDVPGHEGIGRIIKIHPSVVASTVPPIGSKVGVPLIRNPCGSCYACLNCEDGETLCPNAQYHGKQANGSFEQFITLEASYLVPVPEASDDAVIAPILCGGVTAYKSVKKSAVKAGQWLVIAGAGGGIGTLAIQYAIAMGIKVIAIDTGEDKKKKTTELGASAFVDFKKVDVKQSVLELTNGGAQGVVVLAASEVTYNEACTYLQAQGTLVCVGLPSRDVRIHVDPMVIIHKDLRIVGSMVGTRDDIKNAISFVIRNAVIPDIIIYPAENIREIFRLMEKSQLIGRAVIDLK
ncbi:hypothetical protein V1511DRAFT_526609 [Dipodascopsis uninucleata]